MILKEYIFVSEGQKDFYFAYNIEQAANTLLSYVMVPLLRFHMVCLSLPWGLSYKNCIISLDILQFPSYRLCYYSLLPKFIRFCQGTQ